VEEKVFTSKYFFFPHQISNIKMCILADDSEKMKLETYTVLGGTIYYG